MSFRRVAIVTGAAQGIGRSIAIRLAQDGHDVAVCDLSSKKAELEEVAAEISRLGAKALVIPADVSVEDQVEYLVSQTAKQLGGLDVMVANAGIATLVPFFDCTVTEFTRLYQVNVLGTMLCYRIAGKFMAEQGRGGRLIGASSVAGKKSATLYAPYSATKFAIRGLTQAVACELAKFGITANAYAPGGIDTDMLSSMDTLASDILKVDKGVTAGALARMAAARRLGKPSEIASLVSFLASNESAYITGQTITIDGGIHFD